MKDIHQLATMYGDIWAIREDRLRSYALLLADALGQSAEWKDRVDEYAASTPKIPTVKGNVAVLPIRGLITPKANALTFMLGWTALDTLKRQVDFAMSDTNVSGLLFDVDSDGGLVTGTPEMSDYIHSLRGQKPMVAIANYSMHSAAYWLASAADVVVASPSSGTGSLGVYGTHFDYSKQNEMIGVAVEYISAGKYKTEGNPDQPLTDDARTYLQSRVDKTYGDFVAAVARNRGESKANVIKNYGEGRSMRADEALGTLVDRVATIDEVLAKMTATKKTNNTTTARARLELEQLR